MINGIDQRELPRVDIFDKGIPVEILQSLRATFKELDIFQSDEDLRKFIFDECPNLNPWKHRINEADSTRDRVDFLISLLSREKHVDHGNALLIFLKYLEEKKDCNFSVIWEATPK